MKKNRVHFVLLGGLMAGTLFGAEIPAQAEKAQQKGRIAIEKEMWQKGLAAAKKRHWNGQQLTKKERDYYNALGKRLGITALLAAIGIGVGVARVKQQRRIRAEEDAAWAARQAMFEQQDALNLAYEQSQERGRRQQEIDLRFRDAVGKGYLAEVKRFLEQGVNINGFSRDPHPPLVIAVEKGNKEMLDWLLESGADVNVRESIRNHTPLIRATIKGEAEMVERLLQEEGIEVDAIDYFLETALMKAVQRRREKIVKLLLEKGVDLTIENEDGKTAYDIALEKGYTEIAKMIQEKNPQTLVGQ